MSHSTMPGRNPARGSSALRRAALITAVAALAAGTLVPATAQAQAPRSQLAAVALPVTSPPRAVAGSARTTSAVHAAVLATGDGCTPAGSGVSCDLWAKAGSITLPGASSASTIWSFVSHSGDNVTVPVGPTLVVTAGQSVDLVLHNQVSGERVSLSLPQVDQFDEDLDGVTSGNDRTYTFTASRPGTYVYQAGGTTDGARQVAMGLVGALVVLPDPPGTAYGTAQTAYNDEGVLVMTDIDPALNAAPGTFDMRNFSPRFRLFNGRAYPTTQPIPVDAGTTALLRVVNAGLVQHAISVLGTTAQIVGTSARPLSHPYTVASENIAAGDTLDALVPIPAAPGLKYAVLDPSVRLDNDGKASSAASGNIVEFGGQLTFLQASGSAPDPGATPVVTNLVVTPTRVGSTPTSVAFSATVTDDTAVTGVEYVIDNAATPAGSGTAVTGFTSGPSVALSNVAVDVSALGTGTHQVLVRGRDVNGWGPLQGVSFAVDKSGPTISGITPAAAAVNGSSALAFSGSASDVGGGKVASATWSLDGGAPNTATISPSSGAATVSLAGSVPAATLTALSEGSHTLTAIGTDDLGNVGPSGPTPAASFLVDRTGPSVGTVTVSPSPNDGTQGVAYDPTSIEVRATFSDGSGAGVASGEGFLTTAGSPGTGFPMVINSSALVATVPLSQITSLPDGNNPIWVRAKDKAGNWGTAVAGTLVMARPAKVIAAALAPTSSSFLTAPVVLTGTAATPPGGQVAAAEYFITTDPGIGLATPVTLTTPNAATTALTASIPVSAFGANPTVGQRSVFVRAKAANGLWGPAVSVPLTLTTLFSDGFESGLPGPWNALTNASGGTASATALAALTGTNGLQVTVSGGGTATRAYVTTPTTTAVPTYRVRFQMRPALLGTLVTGTRWVTVERALNGSTEVFRIEYQRTSAGATPQVRAIISVGAGGSAQVPSTGSLPLQAATNTIRLDWTSATAASVRLTVNATTTPNNSLNTNGRQVTQSQFGLSSVGSGAGTFSGNLYLDAFDSSYYPLP